VKPETARTVATFGFTVNEALVPVEPSVAVIVVEPETVDVTEPVFVPLTNAPKVLDPVQEEDVKLGFPV